MFYDSHKPKAVTNRGLLPHWHQDRKVQYVTFRLGDSLPATLRSQIKFQIEQFYIHHPQPWDKDTQKEFYNIIDKRTEDYLDNGYGSCILKQKSIRDIVSKAIMYKDNVDYNVIAFVIMPNHVHLLIQPLEDNLLSNILHSIKRFTAASINKALNRHGQLWMKESFDRIVRGPEHLNHYIEYIKNNPKNLPSDHYQLYVALDKVWR